MDNFARYFTAYTLELKGQPFESVYVDAFSGTGYRSLREGAARPALLFPELAEDGPQALLEATRRLAVRAEPRFHETTFVDRVAQPRDLVQELAADAPDRVDAIRLVHGEPNAVIQELCNRTWSARRGVLFLDPFGFDIEWSTIRAIARTCAIDLWLFLPVGMGVNRLSRSGGFPASWCERIDALLGRKDWIDSLDAAQDVPSAAPSETRQTRRAKARLRVVGKALNDRLEAVFAAVAPNPRVLMSATNRPLYLMCFAVGNPVSAAPALRLAKHILGDVG